MAALDLAGTIGLIITAAVPIPYIAWGIYTLRLRYRYHQEMSTKAEAVTLVFAIIFFVIEMFLLRRYVGHLPLHHMFSILGLVVSGAALYGHVLVSLLSRILVDLLMPPEKSRTHEPRYAPAEALERDGDFEGALHEYITIARIFPKEPATFIRIADICLKLERPGEAASWLQRALPFLHDPEQHLSAVNRLCEINIRSLGRVKDAIVLLDQYLLKFPDSPFVMNVKSRRERLLSQLQKETLVAASQQNGSPAPVN